MADLEDRVAWARRIHNGYGIGVAEDDKISALLSRYREAIEKTCKLMVEKGVASACSVCAGKCKGGCCFHGMEEDYDVIHLLINLLLGNPIGVSKTQSGECWFLGERGCTLTAKAYFCLNYFCPQLNDALGAQGMGALLEAVWQEHSAAWEVDRALRFWLRIHSAMDPD
jgi:hypothetical protein